MNRKLTDDERELWERLRRTVKPLGKRPPAKVAGPSGEEPPGKRTPAAPARLPPTPSPQPAATRSTAGPALAPLEPRTRRRVVRGIVEVDARIDLHGMRQERAFHALVSFLRRAQSHGDRLVLVVTGKGRAGEEGRGVLRESVPAWLARPDLRHLVVGWEEAGRRHGGAGALYVRVRRRREAIQPRT